MTCAERHLHTALFAALAAASLALDTHSRGVAWAFADANIAALAYVAAGVRGWPGPWGAAALAVGGLLLGVVLAAAAAFGTVVFSLLAEAHSVARGAFHAGLRPPALGLPFALTPIGAAALSESGALYAVAAVAALALVLGWPFAVVVVYGADPETLLAGTGALPLAAAALGCVDLLEDDDR